MLVLCHYQYFPFFYISFFGLAATQSHFLRPFTHCELSPSHGGGQGLSMQATRHASQALTASPLLDPIFLHLLFAFSLTQSQVNLFLKTQLESSTGSVVGESSTGSVVGDLEGDLVGDAVGDTEGADVDVDWPTQKILLALLPKLPPAKISAPSCFTLKEPDP